MLQGGILSRVEPLDRALDCATANVYLEVIDFRCYLHVASWIHLRKHVAQRLN